MHVQEVAGGIMVPVPSGPALGARMELGRRASGGQVPVVLVAAQMADLGRVVLVHFNYLRPVLLCRTLQNATKLTGGGLDPSLPLALTVRREPFLYLGCPG